MIKFRDLMEQSDTIVFTFGRFNPPTTGHEKLIEKVASVAGRNQFRIYPSKSVGKKDPLPHDLKIRYMKKMFPKYKKNIMSPPSNIVIDIVVGLYNEGYRNLIMVAGSDRVKEFESLITKYNGVEGKRHGFYNFDTIKVVSAGERDPDAEGVEGMSASKMRAAATANNYDEFKLGLPKGFTEGEKLFKDVKKHMGISETVMSEDDVIRDLYIEGHIYKVGDVIRLEETSEYGEIVRRGTNYVSFISEDDGLVKKAWIHDILEVKQDKDVKDREGTQPAKYYAKDAEGDDMAKSTKAARARHFEKGAKKDDDDDSAYKPAPGDKSAKTKPSKYTQAMKKKYPELYEGEATDAAKERIEKEKQRDLEKFKDMMDRAKREDDVEKEAETKRKEVEKSQQQKPQNESLEEDADKSIAKKAEKSGISAGILKQVYKRGVAAWRTGHRPGTTPEQWGHARVNSFITGGKTRTTADADLWKKHKGKSESVEEARKPTTAQIRMARKLKKHGVGKNDDYYLSKMDPETRKKYEPKKRPEPMKVEPPKGKTFKWFQTAEYQPEETELQEDWFTKLLNKYLLKPRTYKTASQILQQVLDKKKKDGKLAHSTEYYAAQIAKQFKGVDARDLAKMVKVEQVKEWYRLDSTRSKYQEKYGEEWVSHLDETYKKMIDKIGYKPEPMSFSEHTEDGNDIREAVIYHLENEIPFAENVYRLHSDNFYKLFETAREMYQSDVINVDSWDRELLESDIGTFGIYEGQNVPLDIPIAEEEDVELNKPKRGGPKKFYVYVKNDKGNVVKVTFGDTTGLKAKIDDPDARKSFAARHKCDMQNDKTKAAYWACRLPKYAKSLGLSGGGNFFW